MISAPRLCPKCGSEIPADALSGLKRTESLDEYLANRLRFGAFPFWSLRVGLIPDLHR